MKAKLGRPPLPRGKRMSVAVMVKMRPETRERLKAKAKAHGQPLAVYLREKGLADTPTAAGE